MPATKLQLAANRLNADHSTGPRTPEGKHRASLNAYTHGLTGQTVVLPHEDMEAYKSHCQAFFQDLDPETAVEKQLVQTLVDSQWLLNRCHSHEISLYALEDHEISGITHQIEVLGRHGQRLSRRFQTALKQLLDLQTRRTQQERAEMPDAIAIAKLYKMKGKPYDLSKFGFVLKNPQIDLYLRRTEALEEAKQAGAPATLTCYPNRG